MDSLDQFSIPIVGLSEGLHGYDFVIEPDFFQAFEGSPIQEGKLTVHLDFEKRHDMFVMEFELNGTVKVTCDRCLDPFDFPIDDHQVLMVKFDDKEWEEAEVVYILRGIQKFNVARYVYEFINLAVPMVKTHDDAGESCNPEMLGFLEAKAPEDIEVETPKNNPFGDALKDFNFEN